MLENNEKPRILIVDDDESVRELLILKLKEKNFCIRTAKDGQEALKQIKKRKPDLIILDRHMPIMGGTSMYFELQSYSEYKDISVIFYTSDVVDLPEGVEFINKFSDVEELLKKVDRVLNID